MSNPTKKVKFENAFKKYFFSPVSFGENRHQRDADEGRIDDERVRKTGGRKKYWLIKIAYNYVFFSSNIVIVVVLSCR